MFGFDDVKETENRWEESVFNLSLFNIESHRSAHRCKVRQLEKVSGHVLVDLRDPPDSWSR